MTVARDLAEFLTGTSMADLPAQAVEHAAMLIASTISSAAMGSGLELSTIISLAGPGAGRQARGVPVVRPGTSIARG